MFAVPRILLVTIMLLAAWSPSARAQLVLPLRVYAFAGTLNDSMGGPALVSSGGIVGSNSYSFGANQGLTLTDPAFDPTNYTIEINLSFQDLSSWKKIADFSNLSLDYGLYSYGGSLQFFGGATSPSVDFAVNTPVDVVLTRSSSTGLVTGYVNGLQVLSFTDSGGIASFGAAGSPLAFFVDDTATGQREAAAGTVNWIRLYNQPFAAPDVLTLFQAGAPAAVPEPSACLLLGLGLTIALGFRRTACQRR